MGGDSIVVQLYSNLTYLKWKKIYLYLFESLYHFSPK